MSPRTRNPWLVWVFAIITLGIYSLVWIVKVNGEARTFLGDDRIKPAMIAAYLIVGILLFPIILIVIFETAQRVRNMERQAQVATPSNPALSFLLTLIFGLGFAYMQNRLNHVAQLATPSPPPLNA